MANRLTPIPLGSPALPKEPADRFDAAFTVWERDYTYPMAWPVRVEHLKRLMIAALSLAEPVGLPALHALLDQIGQHRRTFDGTTEYVEWAIVQAVLSTTTPPTRVDGDESTK